MSVDQANVRRIANLARIKVSEADVPHLQGEINAIITFVEESATVDFVVTDGAIPVEIVANAPVSDDYFFVVPKVVE
jgi:aspartyl-tRNA(Asn)/glutamyl-tRNA(Gln) amidotransferase subunit C